MNDTELTAAVRESIAGIHSATPVEEIVSRGRRARARRRIPLVAGAAAVVSGAALAATALMPAAHQAGGRSSTVRLAAWTVTRQANGQIDLTISQFKDPARLQATLRSDGLPVIVSFPGPRLVPSACEAYDPSPPTLRSVFNFTPRHGSDFLTITPSALPRGAAVAIYDGAGKGSPADFIRGTGHPPVSPPAGQTAPLLFGLVHASQQCSG